MTDNHDNVPLVDPRSNPSDAEKYRKPTKKEKTTYRMILVAGIVLFFLPITLIILAAMELLPRGNYGTVIVVLGIGFFASIYLIDIGFTKGRDHRPPRGGMD